MMVINAWASLVVCMGYCLDPIRVLNDTTCRGALRLLSVTIFVVMNAHLAPGRIQGGL
jgi:hypothetical protein